MEDALISEMGLAVLTGAGLYNAGEEKFVPVHVTERCEVTNSQANPTGTASADSDAVIYVVELDSHDEIIESYSVNALTATTVRSSNAVAVIFDYYTDKSAGKQININAKDFAGTYYLEASTLFRDADGTDHAAEFIIPKCKLQSNFTFTMASSGDPSTFTFTMDAFPDYTKFDREEKVFASIQVIDDNEAVVAKDVSIYAPNTAKADSILRLTAKTEPANAPVEWTAVGNGATIDKVTGKLTLSKDATGVIEVTATAKNGSVSDTHEIEIVTE